MASGSPWKLPPLMATGVPSVPKKIRGLSVALFSSISTTQRVYLTASWHAPCTWGMQRNVYASCTSGWSGGRTKVEPSSSRRIRAAASTCLGCGLAAWSRASNAHSVPCSASRLRPPATSAHNATFSASTTARQPSAAMSAVPFVSARPSFASRVTGASPARCSASSPLMRCPPYSASPSPIRTRAMCASGARSPDAPSEPCAGTMG